MLFQHMYSTTTLSNLIETPLHRAYIHAKSCKATAIHEKTIQHTEWVKLLKYSDRFVHWLCCAHQWSINSNNLHYLCKTWFRVPLRTSILCNKLTWGKLHVKGYYSRVMTRRWSGVGLYTWEHCLFRHQTSLQMRRDEGIYNANDA